MALDGLGEKLKSLFKPKDDNRFMGQGRRLGTAELRQTTQSCSSKLHQPQHVVSGVRTVGRSEDLGTGAAPTVTENPSPPKPPPQPLGPGSHPTLVVSRSHRTEDVVLDAAVMANTPTGREAYLLAAHKPPGEGGASHRHHSSPTPQSHYPNSPVYAFTPCGGAGSGTGGERLSELRVDVQRSGVGGQAAEAGGGHGSVAARGGTGHPAATSGRAKAHVRGGLSSTFNSMVSTISTPTAAEKRMGGFRCPAPPTDGAMADYGLAPATSQAYELQRCLALVLSSRPLSNSSVSTTSSVSALPGGMVVTASASAFPVPPPAAPRLASSTSYPEVSAAAAAVPPPPGMAAGCTSASASGAGAGAGAALTATEAADGVGAVAPSGAAASDGNNPHPNSNLLTNSVLSTFSLSSTPTTTASNAAAAGWEGPAVAAVVGLLPTPGSASAAEGGWGGTGAMSAGSGEVGGGAGRSSRSFPSGAAGPRECCDALLRILRNAMTRPDEPKFRQIRLSNPKVQETIVGVPGAVEFLEAAGFQMRLTLDDGSDTANLGYLILPDEVASTALAEPFRILSAVMAAHGFTATTASSTSGASGHQPQHTLPPPKPTPTLQQQQQRQLSSAQRVGPKSAAPVTTVPAIERCTQVLLPVAPDVEVPDWFFERTGVEIREQWMALMRKREEQERFMTRTMREVRRQQEAVAAAAAAAAAGSTSTGTSGPAGAVATVRVRFPEGVCLQGQFGAAEPVTRVFEWVASSLRSPLLTFELIKPDRRPLEAALTTATAPGGRSASATGSKGAASSSSHPSMPLTIRTADMLPSTLLNLRPTGPEAAELARRNLPLLSDALLRTTKPQ